MPASPDPPKPELKEEALESAPASSDDPVDDMMRAFFDGDTQRAEEAYKEAQSKAENDPYRKLRTEAIYLYMRYTRGDVRAFERLQDLAQRAQESPEALPLVHNFIGSAYERGDDFLKASESYEAAAEAAQTEEQRAPYVTSAAQSLFNANKRQEAFARIQNEIDRDKSREALSIFYRGLAALYEKAGSLDLRAIALQKATEYRPNDTQLRFDAAYSSSQGHFSALALMHYRTLLRFAPDRPSALNNIGVIYGEWQMPIKEVNSYKKAFQVGNTLAAANLAFDYMNAGFADEAAEVLKKAKEEEEIHGNVGKALAALVDAEDAEGGLETQALHAAREQRQFLLSFAEAYFISTPSGNNPQLDGEWRFSDSVEAIITRNNGELEIKWERGGKEYVMTARVQNRGALITKYSRKDSYFSPSLGDKGYAYLTQNDRQMKIMVLKDRRHSFLTFERHQE